MNSRRWLDAVIIVAFACGYWLSASRLVRPVPYGYDEADYMYAASLGFRANWLDARSIPFSDFLRRGSNAGSGAPAKTSLSTYIRSRGDLLFYRHWHGPLYYYWLAAAAPRFGHNEAAMHRFALIFPVLAFVLVYCGLRSLIPGREGLLAAVLFGFLYLFSYSNIRTASMLGPHSLFVLLCLTVVICLAKLTATGRLRYWYAAVMAAGLALASPGVACLFREQPVSLPSGPVLHRSAWAGIGEVGTASGGPVWRSASRRARQFPITAEFPASGMIRGLASGNPA
jgi:hypothetical protein